jgi:hypothetical protein
MRAKWLTAAASFSATVTVSSFAGAQYQVTDDPVLYWNQLMTSGTTALVGPPPVVARSAAMMNLAVYDAVNSSLGNPNAYYLPLSTTGGDVRAAASQAAHDVLIYLNPGKTADYDAALVASLALIPDATARDAGVATGTAYAGAIISARSGDGAATAASTPYTPGSDPGDWVPTPPGNLPAALPGWGDVTAFFPNSAQTSVGPPPALDSVEYANAYNEVMAIGAAGSLTRTADQTEAAQFWAAAGGASWITIGLGLASDEGMSTLESARLFALLGAGISDAFVTVFGDKYEYNLWRPVTAIHEGDNDGNLLTVGDPSWTSLIVAPNHPSYYSAHGVADGTAGAILLGLIGDESFCATFGGIQRCWNSIGDASQEGADSRIWGGIHFPFDGATGLQEGHEIGLFALTQLQPVPEPSTWLTMLVGFGFIGWTFKRRRAPARYKPNLMFIRRPKTRPAS